MYLVYYGDQFVHDAYSDDRKVHDGKLSGDVNDFLTLEFTVPPTNPAMSLLKAHDYESPVRVTFDDQELFRGYIEYTQEQLNTEVKVYCKGDMSLLADSVVRPYTTRADDTEGGKVYIGQGYDTMFEWFISQHNSHVLYQAPDGTTKGYEKQFKIQYPSGSGTDLETECEKLVQRIDSTYHYSQSKPTTLQEIQKQILEEAGGYIQLWYNSAGDKCLALYADVPDILKNNQVIQFGYNMTEYEFENTCVDTYTAIRAQGGNDDNGTPVTLSGIPDGVKSSSYYKRGDVVYHMANAEAYGYREYAWSNSDITNANSLLANAIVQLQRMMVPTQSIDASAMDLVFVNSEYKHLLPGQEVTVQSFVHNVDVELLVSSCDIDFDSPGSTKYTLGSSATRITKSYGSIMEEITVAADTATGAQRAAGSAGSTALAAQQAAAAATAVSVKQQGQTGIPLFAADDADDFFMPAENIAVIGSLVSTGSIRQLSLVIVPSAMIQSGEKIGTLHKVPAVETPLMGDVAGHIDADGTIVTDQNLEISSEYTVSAIFVIGAADA